MIYQSRIQSNTGMGMGGINSFIGGNSGMGGFGFGANNNNNNQSSGFRL